MVETLKFDAWAAFAKEAAARGVRAVSCGLNADWNCRCLYLGEGAPNVTDGGLYLFDNEDDDSLDLIRYYPSRVDEEAGNWDATAMELVLEIGRPSEEDAERWMGIFFDRIATETGIAAAKAAKPTKAKTPKTIEYFRATRFYGANRDAWQICGLDEGDMPVGYNYPGNLFIQDLGPAVTKRFYLVLDNEDFISSDIEGLEVKLYEWWLDNCVE